MMIGWPDDERRSKAYKSDIKLNWVALDCGSREPLLLSCTFITAVCVCVHDIDINSCEYQCSLLKIVRANTDYSSNTVSKSLAHIMLINKHSIPDLM